ncbi:beta-ketoacyl synthase chain length factor [Dyadobacter sp. CY261]|uniref:beta-ketoacyl synthase chain length factor n=1 Tax=Dyadobacter sp. CY261 TaxID=2907203 RepID=UPI001F39DCF6|nr:beta-ketoacyl synthase chain length factor [Dyadobacter sp. CY261]MCF0073789.1 beta-ketoacyl synthase chain length factor [Dyadobacter sp. CY261]
MNKAALYITAASTVSHQPTFGNPGFSSTLGPIVADNALISPDYKAYIDPGLLRRMSKILRMAVACSKDCIAQAEIEQPDAIVVGTGLGCLHDTEKFLNTSLTVDGLLPPTSFIQSTHNTMAGQISLSIGNHGYNMTHTQNTLSFEHALLDASMLLREGDRHVLVGAADEHIDILEDIAAQLSFEAPARLTSGASFFVLSKENRGNAAAILTDVHTTGGIENAEAEIDAFLIRNGLNASDVDLVFHAGEPVQGVKGNVPYLPLSGVYATASAFALHYAVDSLQTNASLKNVLICNALRKSNLGLILLQSVEA